MVTFHDPQSTLPEELLNRDRQAARWSWPRIVAVLAVLTLGLWAYRSTLADLLRIWGSSPDYSHGYLVAPLAAWFLWRRRDSIPRIAPSWMGVSLLLLAAAMRMVAARFYIPELDGCSLPVWLAGVCWLFGGGALTRWAAPALAFLVFMVPLPATFETLLINPLRALATTMSTWTLQSLGQPAIAEGMTILLDDHRLEVERACSGLRMFYGIFALACASIIVTRARLSVALTLLAAVAPVAILSNVMRITLTAFLYQYVSGEVGQRFSHDLAGLVMIVFAVLLFALVLLIADKTFKQYHTTRARALLRTAVVLLVVAALVPVCYFWHESRQQRAVESFLRRADQLEQAEDYAAEFVYLDRYLRVRHDDIDVRERLAKTGDRIAVNPLRKLRVMELYQDVWNRDPRRIELGIRQGELAIELARNDDALDAVKSLDKITPSLMDRPQADRAQSAAARLKALALLGRSTAPDVVVPEAGWKEIVTAFQEAIKRNPADIELSARLADIYRHHLRTPAEAPRQKLADAVMDSMVANNSARPDAWLTRYIYRKSLKAAGEKTVHSADTDLDQALAIGRADKSKESADVLLYAGQRASEAHDAKTAQKFFHRATEVQPGDFRGWLRLGELAAADGSDAGRARAVEIWNQGLEHIGQYEIDLVLPLTAALVELRRFADAEEKLRPLDRAIRQLVEPGRSLVELGVVRLRANAAAYKGNIAAAANLLRAILNGTRAGSASAAYRAPFAGGWLQLGDYYSQLRFDDLAVEAYETAGRLDPEMPDWRTKAAQAAERSGRPGDALPHFRELVKKDPSAANWLAEARACLLEQVALAPADRNWHEFEEAFRAAVAAKANPVMLYLLEADYTLASGTPDKAAIVLNKGTSRIPQAWELWQALAVCDARRHADAEAQKALAEFRKHAPNPETIALLEARLAEDKGRFDDARKVLEAADASASASGKTAIRNQLVQLDLRQGRRATARRRLQEWVAQEPDNLQMLDMLGQLIGDEADWAALEEVENHLKQAEGEDGSLWRELRSRRLLAEAVELDDSRVREAERLAREIAALRPTWNRRYVLQGQIARRENQLDEAIADYQQAIRLGNRSIGLSEELIDLLTQQHRFTEADREFERVRQAVAQSSRLSTVAIPIYVRRGESEEALRLAEDWVRRQPDDASSYLRLGQTILLTTLQSSPEYPKALARAQTAYERAVALAPTDVRVWVSLFRFYTGVQKDEEAAGAMLRRLAQRIDIPQPQKVFVLAQLYESIGRRAEAGRFYLEAIKLAPAASQSVVLLRAARFFVADDPAQAESYCRQILKWHPKSMDARRTLVRALAEQGGEARLHEAATLLTEVGRVGESTAADKRIEALLLARTGRNEDRSRATELLETLVQIPQQAQNQDRVLLASLYESDHRLMPAYEQLLAASRQDNVSSADLVQYAEFLYRNQSEQRQFADYLEPVLAKLEQDPQGRAASIRLRLEAAKRIPRESQRKAKIRATIDDASRRFIAAEKDATLRRDTFSKLLFLLAHENLTDEAVSLVTDKSPCTDPIDTAISLADALTLLPPGSKLARATDPVLRRAVDEFPRSAELAYAIGNCRYVTQAWADSVAMYRRVLEIQPDHKLAMNNLALALSDRSQTAPEALELIDRAIKRFGADSALMDTKGQILVAMGRPQEGLSVLADAAASRGGDALLLLHIANAYLAVGKAAEARAAYRRARTENVADRVVTPADRALLERLEAHLHQTATAGG